MDKCQTSKFFIGSKKLLHGSEHQIQEAIKTACDLWEDCELSNCQVSLDGLPRAVVEDRNRALKHIEFYTAFHSEYLSKTNVSISKFLRYIVDEEWLLYSLACRGIEVDENRMKCRWMKAVWAMLVSIVKEREEREEAMGL